MAALLIPDWRRVLQRAWSIRLIALAAALSGLEVALPYFDYRLPISESARGLVYFILTMAAFGARLVAQPQEAHDAD